MCLTGRAAGQYNRAMLTISLLLSAAAGASGWGDRLHSFTEHTAPPARAGHVRLVFIGDTGADPVEPGTDSSHIPIPAMAQLRENVRAEQADAIFGLGDLVYGVRGPLELSPKCRDPTRGKAAKLLPSRLGDYYADMGATAWLVLGNHDVGHAHYSEPRARCLMAYADQTEHLALPSATYSVDFGLARVVVTDTNRDVKDWDPARVSGAYRDDGAWNVLVGHHVLRTAFDKDREQEPGGKHDIRGWLIAHDARPDLWLNGHAHLLQFGVYDDIPAVTSGTGAKIRVRDECPGDRCTGDDAPLFSRSEYGYTVVDLTGEALVVRMRTAEGETRYCWKRGKDDPSGEECPLDYDPGAPQP